MTKEPDPCLGTFQSSRLRKMLQTSSLSYPEKVRAQNSKPEAWTCSDPMSRIFPKVSNLERKGSKEMLVTLEWTSIQPHVYTKDHSPARFLETTSRPVFTRAQGPEDFAGMPGDLHHQAIGNVHRIPCSAFNTTWYRPAIACAESVRASGSVTPKEFAHSTETPSARERILDQSLLLLGGP